MPDLGIENRNVLVVGGGTGIGRAIAERFASNGCQVAISGRRQDKLDDVCATNQSPEKVRAFQADVVCRESVGKLVAWFTETIGPIDILVNAAGINTRDRTMAATRPEEWDSVIQVNATGAFNCMAAVLPGMRARGSGTVVNISSTSGKRASELAGLAYSASKFAMSALGTFAGLEEARNGIRITTVYPGEVDTPIFDSRPVPVSDAHREKILKPADVADVVFTICALPPRAHVPEIVIKPLLQEYC